MFSKTIVLFQIQLDLSSGLICEILCPLPIKELFQCLCLSKEWYAQIHHWDFIKKHLDANREPPVYVIKTFNKYFSIPFLHNDQFGVSVEIDCPHNVHNDSSIIACCDGLVLVRNSNELFIWNMLIRRCWNISVSELPVKKLGDYLVRFYFGHELTGDHKVLMDDLLSETFEL